MKSWREQIDSLDPADIRAVCMITDRDAFGVDYEVRCSLLSLGAHAYEEGEDQIGIWCERVDFGLTDATVAGGARFVEAARMQQQIADECWKRSKQ